MANAQNFPASSPWLPSGHPSRINVPVDTDPHYFPATKNFFCPALLGLGGNFPGEPYRLLQKDYEIQKVSPRHKIWDDEKKNANRLRTRRTAGIESQRVTDHKFYNHPDLYNNVQIGANNSDRLGDLHRSWTYYYHDNASCGDQKTQADDVPLSSIPKCGGNSDFETNFFNLKRMKNCYYERLKEDERLKRKCVLNDDLDDYCDTYTKVGQCRQPVCKRNNVTGNCRANLSPWQIRENCSIGDYDWPNCCQTYFDTRDAIRFKIQSHKPPLDALKTEMDECEKYIREAVNEDYKNEQEKLKLLNLLIIPYKGKKENYLFKYIRKCGERKNLLSQAQFNKTILIRLAKKYGIGFDKNDMKTNLRNRISKELWDSDEYMSKVYDELKLVCNILPRLPLIKIDNILISSQQDIEHLWLEWEEKQKKLKCYISQAKNQFALFRIIDRIKHQKTRKKYFEIDDTPQNMPTKFKIKEEVWKEFLKDVVKFEPDIDSREDTDFVRARNLLGRDHLPNWWYEWFTEEQLKELKTEIERNIIDEIVQQIRNLFPNATILLKKDEDEEERKVVDLWPVWKDKLGNKLEEKFKFIRKIGKKLDPPITRGDRDAGINNILNAFIDKRSILIDGQNKIPTAGDVEHTLLRHSYFKNNPTKIYLTSLNWQKTWKAIQMRNLLEDMPWGGLMECYDNKLRKGKYVDAIWENPPGTVNTRLNPQ